LEKTEREQHAPCQNGIGPGLHGFSINAAQNSGDKAAISGNWQGNGAAFINESPTTMRCA